MGNKTEAVEITYQEPTSIPAPVEEFSKQSKKLSELLLPRDTDNADDGAFVALNNTPAIQFADAASKVAYFILQVPPDLTVANLQFIWSTPATSGNLRWQVDIGEGISGVVNNTRTTGGTAVTTAAHGTANALLYTSILPPFSASGVDLRALRKNGLWGIKFTRTGADAGDTLSNTVNLYGILVTYA